MAISIDMLFADTAESLALTVVAGAGGMQREIAVPRIQKPGLALSGYPEQLHRDRLQTLGATEIEYLASIDDDSRRRGIATLMSADPACVVITRNLSPPAELSAACEAAEVPLLKSELASAELIAGITAYLQDALAPHASIHGVLLDVLGIGILLLGKSGIGKSEAALDLLARGHRLVADDIVNIRRKPPNLVFGSGSAIIRHHMEIRGLGIINIKDIFGISSVRETKKIELVIELCDWNDNEEYERLGLDDSFHEVLGVWLPRLRLPVRPGRSISTIIEVAARNQLLKFMGHHSARELSDQLGRAIAEAKPKPLDADIVE